MRYFLPLLFLTFSSFIWTGCSSSSTEGPTPSIVLPDRLPNDFVDFYQQFHADSTYQREHIQWPLRGVPDRKLAEGETFYFQPDSWAIQRAIDPSSGYVSSFMVITESLVQEEITNAANQTGLLRRFMKDEDGWRLIYYQGVRKLE